MHFSHMHPDSGSKAGKFALVAGLHALIAVGVVNMMNNKVISLPSLPDDLTVFMTPEPPKPPPTPPEPPKPMPQLAPPEVVVPKVEVDIPLPPVESPVRTTTEVAPPQPAQPAQAEAPPQPATPSTNTGTMRSAVLADAGSCATPTYPAAAARNGDSGTTTLALLVGTDGRVTSAKVQGSSGSRDLDRAAVSALSLCRFKPAMNNGAPEAGWAQIAYVWTLE